MPDEAIRCQLTIPHTDFILRNHHVYGVSLLPGVTFVDILLRILTARGFVASEAILSDILFDEAIATGEDLDREVMVTVGAEADGAREITVRSRSIRTGETAGDWRQNLTARLTFAEEVSPPPLDIAALKSAAHTVRDLAELYEQARQENIVHGPAMRCQGRIYLDGDGLLAELELDPSTQHHENQFHAHPAKLDASTLIAFAQSPKLDAPFIPISLAAVRVLRPLRGRCYVHAAHRETVSPSGDVMHNNYRIYDDAGQLAAEFTRLACKRIRFPESITALIDPSSKPRHDRSVGQSGMKNLGAAQGNEELQAAEFTDALRRIVARELGIGPAEVSTTAGFYDQGLDSMTMLRISRELESVVRSRLYPTLLFEFPNIGALAKHLAETHGSRFQLRSVAAASDPPPSTRTSALQIFKRVWHPAPARKSFPCRDLVLLTFDEDWRDSAAASLRAFGCRVAQVNSAPEFAATTPGLRYSCSFADPGQLGLALDDLAAAGHDLRAFVVLVPVRSLVGDASVHDVFRALASALLSRRPTEPVRVCFLSAGKDGEAPPELAALGAFARTVSAETPILNCRSITVDNGLEGAGLAALLMNELAAEGNEAEVCYRDGLREIPGLEPLAMDGARPDPLRRQGAYILCGGGGSLGKLLAGHLAERYRARLLLVGRSAADDALIEHMAAWRKAGAEVEYRCADITKFDQVEAVVEHAKALFGDLHGVFHLAGEVHDALFFRKDSRQTDAVIAPKLRGAVNLDLATRNDRLDVFVLFSSLSAVLANPGQSDYAYANAFLDRFAAWRRRQSRSGESVAIGWPYWAEGGMRLDQAAVESARLATGLEPLPAKVGLEAFASAVRAGEPHVVVAYGDAARFQAALPGGAAREPEAPTVYARAVQPALARGTELAIIGFSGRYPGASNIPAFWKNLVEGRDAITEIPPERWDHKPFFDASRGKRGKTYSRWGGFIQGVDKFAHSFFSISRRDAERMDPQERLFLQEAWHALEDAGYPPEKLTGERVGVFAGVMWNHYQLIHGDDGVAPLALHSSVPNRVSYCFGLTGPSVAVDTACSSSLVAVHMAIESIGGGDSTMALAGGVNFTLHPQKYLQLAEDQFLSNDGRCRTFGSGGTGYVPGEGVGVLVLKPLERALADGDHIDAIVKASSVNHSGRTSGYTVPDPAAQAELIKEALARSGIPASSISYIEAHGAGTSLGDPIEIEGLHKAFAGAGLRAASCAIGSVKSNIGHLESAAGVAGITKVLLQMRHRELVPSLHAAELNPHIDFSSSPFFVQRQRTAWRAPKDGPLRAGVSAFGAGGTNAHVILESYRPPIDRPDESPGEPVLIVLSAPGVGALNELARSLIDHLAPSSGGGAPLDKLRIWVAELAGVDAGDIDVDASLLDLGLDTERLAAIGRRLAGSGTATSVLADPNRSIRELAGDTDALTLPSLRDVAFTLQAGRRALEFRLALIVSSMDALRVALRRFLDEGRIGDAGYVGQPAAESGPAPECVGLFRAGRLREVAERWASGAAVEWQACYSAARARPRRVSLPGTPLPEERCWAGDWKRAHAQSSPPPEEPGNVGDLQFPESGIAVLTMRDQANRNVFTDAMLRHLEQSFAKIGSLPDVKVVVLCGAEQIFCMGGAPAALEALATRRETFTDAAFVYEGLLRCDRPVVAAVQGQACGGGLAFGLYADVVVMSREGAYSANFLKFGFTPGMGASYILEHRFGAALAAEMLMTGRTYRGQELEQRGAQVLFEAPDQVLPRALNLARSMAAMPADALRVLKKELARRTLDKLSDVIPSEVAMHDQVLGEGAAERVRQRLAPTGGHRGDSAAKSAPVSTSAGALDRQAVIHRIEATLCGLLYVKPDEIRHDRSVSDMGVDSIGAVEIVRDLNQTFGVDLDSVALYDHPTVRQLAAHVVEVHAQQQALHATVMLGQAEPLATAPAPAPVQAVVVASSPPDTQPAVRIDLVPIPSDDRPKRAAPPGGEDPTAVVTPPPPDTPVRISLSPISGGDRPQTSPMATTRDRVARPPEIAIIGMSGRFPDAPDLETFWENLRAGVRSIREIPASRWDVSAVFDPDASAEGKTYSRWAALLADVDGFDHRFFNLSPLDAQEMDPQQRLFLMESWKALEDAGYAGAAEGQRCGVFAGCAAGDYAHLLEQAGRLNSAQAFLGNAGSILPARVAYFLDFHGPTVAVDTACSSSLVAVHLACQSLRSEETDLALAGGVALMLTPSLQVRTSRVGMLSPTGTSAPFGAAADGIVLGEGVGVVVLKRLADAIRDRDNIYGCIRASGMNGDGRTNGITAPSASAQAALLRRIHSEAGVASRDITYVEAHGTGTALGDPIEFKALAQVLGEGSGARNFCGLGSVKGNIGHTTMTAGVAGLIKVLLALRHRQLPPTPAFVTPNPKVDFNHSPLFMVKDLRDWVPGPSGHRIAAVSSFGFSGTNCHLIVAEPPSHADRPAAVMPSTRAELVPLSARTEPELLLLIERLSQALTPRHSLGDIAFTLSLGRRHMAARMALVGQNPDDLRGKLLALASGAAAAQCWRGVVHDVSRAGAPLAMNAGSAQADLESWAAAYTEGRELDWASRFRGQTAQRVPLPSYPFTNVRHWVEVTGPPAQPQPADPQPGRMLDPAEPLVADHQVGGCKILAGAAYIELAVAAAERHGYKLPIRVSRIRWLRPLNVERPFALDVRLTRNSTASAYRIGDGLQPHGSGNIEELRDRAGQHRLNLATIRSRCSKSADVANLYHTFDAAGLRYGPSFRLLRAVAVGQDEAVATLAPLKETGLTVPAAHLDAAFQAVATLEDLDDKTPLVPVGVRSLDVYATLHTAVHAVVRRSAERTYDIDVTDDTGLVLLHVQGLALRPPDPLRGKVFMPVWHTAPVPAPRNEGRTAVIFRLSMKGFADTLRRHLSAARTFMLPCDNREPDASWLKATYDTIYFLALSESGSSSPELDGSVTVLFNLVKGLISAGRQDHALTLKVVVGGAVATSPDEPVRPHAAALLGLTRTVAAEYPGWRVGCLDVGVALDDLDDVAHRVAAEDAVERLVALRGTKRLVRSFSPATLPALAGSPFRPRGVYLLLGGAGGIGFALSLHLARTTQARLVWIGRRPEDAAIRNRISDVVLAGGEVVYLRADAADASQMAMAVEEAHRRFGPIHGAVHTAAVLRDRMLCNMSLSDLEQVLAAKVQGSVNLRQALAHEPLHFLAFFSSAASLVDSAGQGNYAAASTFEDAYAAHLRRAGIPVTLVNWGYWGSLGAVADEYHHRLLAADGIGSLEPALAFAAFERALAAKMEQVLVIEATPTGLTHFGIGASPGKADRQPSHSSSHREIEHSRATAYVRRIFAEVLKFPAEELDDHSTFEEFGVDSVTGSMILARLERDLGSLPSTLLFEEMTADRLAKRLILDRGAQLATVLAPAPAAPLSDSTNVDTGPKAAFPREPAQLPASGDIAVIGVTGRYPQAPDIETLWRNLEAGVSGIREVPADRWDWRRYVQARKGPQYYQRWGGFIDGVDMFDAALFGILPRDAVNIDPQERLFLETCWNLLEQTGYLGLSHEPDTGVFVGLMYGTYGEMAAQLWPEGELSGAHSAYWSVANRVSYTFDLHGPSFAVDSACSSSLTAVHLACESIRRGDCRMAIAGGVNLILHPAHLASLGARNMLAPDGVPKVFDAGADGYVPGEGVGAILLKSLSAALADGDDIWAVIKGSALNAGGKTSGYTVPNPNAQANLIQTALRRAGVDPRTISYVEAHGTGTELGDPIEIAGLARAFRSPKGPAGHCAIGSIKSNIGHLEAAAGIAGLTKVLLHIRHRRLAPTIHLTSLNPKIDLRDTPFEPQTSLAEWSRPVLDLGDGEQAYPLRAGVSSFGAGGANVHVIVEECVRKRLASPPPDLGTSVEHLFVLSAPDRERLLAHAGGVSAFLSSAPNLTLPELAYASQVGRRAFDARLAIVAGSLTEVTESLRVFSDGKVSAAVVAPTQGEGASGPPRPVMNAGIPVDQLLEKRDLRLLAATWAGGATIDWRVLWPAPTPRRAAFPTLPFRRKRYWIDPPAPRTLQANASQSLEENVRPSRVRYERPVWAPAPLGHETRPVRTALLVVDDPVVRAAIAAKLAEHGIDHVSMEQLDRRGSLPDAIVHMAADHLDSRADGVDIDRAFRGVFHLAVDLLARQSKSSLRILCARVERDGQEQPHLIALSGLIKTLAQEHRNCSGVCVALEPEKPHTLAARIAAELRSGEEADVAYRGGVRSIRRMVSFTPAHPRSDYLSGDGSYIVTGGAGALGLHFAELLAERGAGEIVLVGRSELDRTIAGRVAALGGRALVRYERADVGRAEDVERLLDTVRRNGRPLRGLIHGAGVIRDARAINKTPEQIQAVLTPKVAGTLNLDRATAADPLDFFVLFSSVVGQTGNPGQADYAYANAFLDAFAETRARWRTAGHRRGRTLSIGWPLWREGRITVTDATAALLERRWGMVPMSTSSGLAAFEALLAGNDRSALVIESAGDGNDGENSSDSSCCLPEVPADTIRAAPAPVLDARSGIAEKLCRLAADFLLVDAAEVDIHTSLLDMGFDSISMTELIETVNRTCGLDLLPTVLFECPTLAELAEYIARQPGAALGSSAAKGVPNLQPGASPQAPVRGALDIAVIGMAGLLPGSSNLDEFWRHLAAGDDLIRSVPDDREELLKDSRTRHLSGGFIDGVAEFDAELFGIAPREAGLMDPQQRLFLQTVWIAIADAGYRASDFSGTRTGVFAGVSTSDYDDLLTLGGVAVQPHMATGLSHAVLANRVSYTFNLRGPSEAIDTACSSSLVAVARAARALRSGECDMAIAGGVSITLTPGLFIAFSESGMLSPGGRCRTFDKGADGYVRGEGAGALILKRLDRALADGDYIHALIKGSAVNHGGRAASLTAPNPLAQADVLRSACADASVDPSTISYLEAHGTGTKLGDPVEIEAIKTVFTAVGRPSPVAVGSVKTNIGHLEAAAGIAGLLKVVLAMRHGQLPPHLHLKELNPLIRIAGTPIVIHNRLQPWPANPIRRAGVSSFGFGGANAHVVLEDAPPIYRSAAFEGPLVFLLSAPNAQRLAAYAADLAKRLDADSSLDLSSVAFVLQTGREELPERLAVAATTRDSLIAALRAAAGNRLAAGLYRGKVRSASPAPALGGSDNLAAAWVIGATIDWRSQWIRRPQKVPLPIFPLERTRHWFTSPHAATLEGRERSPIQIVDTQAPSGDGAAAATVRLARAQVPGVIRTHLAEILNISPADIADDQAFQRFGLDSIFAMDLAERLSATLGADVQASALYDYDTINALTQFLGKTAAPDPPGGTLESAAAEAVSGLLSGVLGRPLDPQRTFVDNGFTSLDMLRAVSELERGLGPLPKTLLFDQPNLASLAGRLCTACGTDAVARLSALEASLETGTPAGEAVADSTGATHIGSEVVAKSLLIEGSPLAQIVADLALRHGLESGLAGRDIAPLLFLGSGRQGYFEFARRHDAALVWSYTGPASALSQMVNEFAVYARSQALKVNVLSPTRIEEVEGRPFTATPFGVVQQIENLADFSLDGAGMGRLRNMVRRFAKSGHCAVAEYVPGADAAVDRQILGLVDRWAAGKSAVSSYIDTVRESLREGRLSSEHRVFLTTAGGAFFAAVIVTRMRSEAGYLLDVEFYSDEIPPGGLEYTIVRIIEVLRAEGIKVFSFGATFGIKVCDSPNSSPEAERALEELRSVAVLGIGNYRFKRKFLPLELPIYLCQPAGASTDVSQILIMIAGAGSLKDRARKERQEWELHGSPARPASTTRDALLSAVEWNPLRLEHRDVEIDLLTDSWAEREDPWIAERMRVLFELQANAPSSADIIKPPWLPFTLTVAAASGRSAEGLLCRSWPGRRGAVLHNGLFPTWSFHLAEQRFKPVAIAQADEIEAVFPGDLSISKLQEALADNHNPVSFVAIELSCNAGGGRPISLANLKKVRALAESYHVPLVMDASRIVANAVAIAEAEPGQEGRDPWLVVSELLSLADAATLSLSKEAGVTFGGIAAGSLPELNERLQEQVRLRGSEVGLSNRRLLQMALSDGGALLQQVRRRKNAARALWQRLFDGGVPVVSPAGGHCVLLDVGRMPDFAEFAHPVAACLAWMFQLTGIRGGPHVSGGGAWPALQRSIRLAVPVGMRAETADQVGGTLVELFRGDRRPKDLALVSDPSRGPEQAGYRPEERHTAVSATRQEGWFTRQLQELGTTLRSRGYAPANQNLDVVRELVPNVDCRMVTIGEGEIEVLTVGAGPTLLLMHPFNIGAGMFAPLMAGLSDRFRIIVAHQPGVGRTRFLGNLSLEGMATLQRRVLSEMGVRQPVHVGGASVGAIFAQYFALRFPEQILSLTLMGGSYRFANRKGQIDKLEQVIAEDFDSILSGGESAGIAQDRERLTQLLLRCESMDPRTGMRYLDLFVKEPDLAPRLAEIDAPTLILQGRYDSVVGVQTGLFLRAAIRGARYVELPGSGHFVCFTDADAVNRELALFLREAEGIPEKGRLERAAEETLSGRRLA
jgi:acyl transferase domain-containing protein/tryptophanase/pimeloyl-ACP methyl ester carboxylesterase